MSLPPPATTSVLNLLTTHRSLLDTLASFLTVCTHHILFLRNIYPARSFLATRAYNYPVRQNRHPLVCTWINDAITAVRLQLARDMVEKVQLCIYETGHNQVLERWTFDLTTLPAVPEPEKDVPLEDEDDLSLAKPLNLTDLEATFRATLARISSTAPQLKPLPSPSAKPSGPACSFTITLELRSDADRPVGRVDRRERAWMVAEPESFSRSAPNRIKPTGRKEDDGTTTPVRRLEAGELRLELWVEESAAKFGFETPSQRTGEIRAEEMTYGAGTESFPAQFDPEQGYEDVRGTDVNKKPDGGRGGWPVG